VSALLEARGVAVEYRPPRGAPIPALRGVDLDVAEGEVIGIVGGSGSGKSSLALALLGLVRPPGRISAGSCMVAGVDLINAPEAEARRVRGRSVGLVVQNPRLALNPMLAVGPQIVDVYRAHNAVDAAQAKERAVEMLRVVGINDPQRRFSAYPHELSGGMAQRMVIAMALVCAPPVLIADEPTSGLDVTIQAQILDDLQSSAATVGSAVVLITQDLGVVANYCTRVLVMDGGLVVEQANTLDFFRRPAHAASQRLLSLQREPELTTIAEGSAGA
jgi:ABC-type dipeptide/oligopeptide/nickel transport system ATPase component